jgi:hypothetical protein
MTPLWWRRVLPSRVCGVLPKDISISVENGVPTTKPCADAAKRDWEVGKGRTPVLSMSDGSGSRSWVIIELF